VWALFGTKQKRLTEHSLIATRIHMVQKRGGTVDKVSKKKVATAAEVKAKAEERLRIRRQLIKQFSIMLDDSSELFVSNNDVRRLMVDLPRILTAARKLERYPKGLTVPDPNDVIKYNHCSTAVLYRYATQRGEARLDIKLFEETYMHLESCSVCRARAEHFAATSYEKLVCGLPINAGPSTEPFLLSENNITSAGVREKEPEVDFE